MSESVSRLLLAGVVVSTLECSGVGVGRLKFRLHTPWNRHHTPRKVLTMGKGSQNTKEVPLGGAS